MAKKCYPVLFRIRSDTYFCHWHLDLDNLFFILIFLFILSTNFFSYIVSYLSTQQPVRVPAARPRVQP